MILRISFWSERDRQKTHTYALHKLANQHWNRPLVDTGDPDRFLVLKTWARRWKNLMIVHSIELVDQKMQKGRCKEGAFISSFVSTDDHHTVSNDTLNTSSEFMHSWSRFPSRKFGPRCVWRDALGDGRHYESYDGNHREFRKNLRKTKFCLFLS